MHTPVRLAGRRSMIVLSVMSAVAAVAMAIVLGFTAGHPTAAALLLLPVIALPALGPIAFCTWAFANDTNAAAGSVTPAKVG
jgi:hypothetical protein